MKRIFLISLLLTSCSTLERHYEIVSDSGDWAVQKINTNLNETKSLNYQLLFKDKAISLPKEYTCKLTNEFISVAINKRTLQENRKETAYILAHPNKKIGRKGMKESWFVPDLDKVIFVEVQLSEQPEFILHSPKPNCETIDII